MAKNLDCSRRRPSAPAGLLIVLGLTLATSGVDAQRAQSSMPPPRSQSPEILIEAESLAGRAESSSGAVSVQNMTGFGNAWSNGAQLFWRAPDATGLLRNAPRLTLSVNAPAAGEYLLVMRHTRAPDYGDVRVFVSGNAIGGFEGFATRVVPARTEIGRVALAAGANAIVMAIAPRPAGSRGSFVGLDAIELIALRSDRTTSLGTLKDPGTMAAGDAGVAKNGFPLPSGAKLYRPAPGTPDGPPAWSDAAMDISFNGKPIATGQFKWDVSALANAAAIAYQVTAGTFTPLVAGQPLQQGGWLTSGVSSGTSGQLAIPLPLTPPNIIPPANKSAMMADYQVRIVPLRSLADQTVVGAASNVIVVRTYAKLAPGLDITIKTWKVDPTVDIIKFAWVPYKYTAHWPPGCTPAGDEPSGLGVVIEAVSDAWNWVSTAYADAKSFVADTVVSAIATIPPGIEVPKAWVEIAMNSALMAAGVPPNIPNVDKLMSDGAGFLAQQMADQIQIPDEVTQLAAKTGVPVDQAIDKFKNDIKAQAKSAILKGAQKAKAAAEGSGGGPCRGLREYEYIRITLRNAGPAIQKDIEVKIEDTGGAFRNLSFKVPSLDPGEELVVPRYLYDPEHLNLPSVTKWQFESDNRSESWTLWNKKYFGPSFKFTVRVVGYNCASAGGCTAFTSDEYTTPSRQWGNVNSQPFVWP